jgi:hypothetical protein
MRGFTSRIVAKSKKDDAVFVWFYLRMLSPSSATPLTLELSEGSTVKESSM